MVKAVRIRGGMASEDCAGPWQHDMNTLRLPRGSRGRRRPSRLTAGRGQHRCLFCRSKAVPLQIVFPQPGRQSGVFGFFDLNCTGIGHQPRRQVTARDVSVAHSGSRMCRDAHSGGTALSRMVTDSPEPGGGAPAQVHPMVSCARLRTLPWWLLRRAAKHTICCFGIVE